MPNVSNEERLAVITAFGKAVKQAEKQVREDVDEQMLEDFLQYGVTQKQLTVNGQKVGTISARMSKPKVGHFPSISNAQEFVEWLRTSDGGLDTLNRLVTVKPDLVLDAAVADGELPDGCEMVERFEPPMMTGTNVRVQLPKVVEALGNNLGAAAAALLTGRGGVMDDFKKAAVELYELVLEEHAIIALGASTNSKDMIKCFADASLKVNDFLVEHNGDFKKALLEVKANEMLNQEV